jgi:hypothetical protein
MLNNMNAVMPGSIAYAALMVSDSEYLWPWLLLICSKFWHCISSLDDWRTEDDLFKQEEFFNIMVFLLEDSEDKWVKDTLKWWNL